MRSTLLLSSLALAAVAGAQPTILSPTAISGYRILVDWTGASFTPPSLPSNLGPYTTLQDALGTQWIQESGRKTVTDEKGRHVTVGYTYLNKQGWMAEFALPTVPAGMSLASATLSSTATGSSRSISIGLYAGDGLVNAADIDRATVSGATTYASGSVNVDVTSGLRSLLGSGAAYVGVRFDRWDSTTRSGYQSTVVDSWSTPKLTLTFAPQAVPEPAALLPSASARWPFCAAAGAAPFSLAVRQPSPLLWRTASRRGHESIPRLRATRQIEVDGTLGSVCKPFLPSPLRGERGRG